MVVLQASHAVPFTSSRAVLEPTDPFPGVLTRSARASAGLSSGEDVVALSAPRTERQRWWNYSRDPADGAFLCGQRSRVQSGRAVGQVGIAGRLLDYLEQIGLTAVAFHTPSSTSFSLKPPHRWSHQNNPNHQKKTFYLFINWLLVTVGPQPLWWGGAGVCHRCRWIFIWSCVKWTGQF